ncbi:acyl-CoA dehydrogenase family protein [Rhodococcus koreensis]
MSLRENERSASPGEGSGAIDAFRERARGWLAAHSTPPIDGLPTSEAVRIAKGFQADLFDSGLAGITWPAEYGGAGVTSAEQQAFDEESVGYELPTFPFMVSLGMCGPTILDLGTPEQKRRYIPPLLRGDEIWCQLFSEPGAGSDVASLQTRAVRDGDGWVVNGQKVWTSRAHIADFGILIARTNPRVPKHEGITMFVFDMHAPGVTVRPLPVMSGRSAFNEVFIDDVRLPADAVIGEVDAGWKAAVLMLEHERVSIGFRRPAKNNALSFDALRTVAERRGLLGDKAVRLRLAEFYSRERAIELLGARFRQEAMNGVSPGARGSVTKLEGAVQIARGVQLATFLAGSAASAWDESDERGAELARAINAAPSAGIAGGTNEIQRNIIGERVLGLPREQSTDRGIPFQDLLVGTQRG